jgi:PTS system N-acetylglucosamine-specific IIC component
MFAYLQRIGRALMLPIAVLPAAGLALRLGQTDAWNIPWLAQAGGSVFDNLPILFAVGVAAGFTADVGTAAVAAFVGYLMFNATGSNLGAYFWPGDLTSGVINAQSPWTTGVLGGIMFGIIGAELYNRFHSVKLPEFLAFFGGRRFVPIVTAFTAVVLGIVFGVIWHFPQIWLHQAAVNVSDSGAAGAAIHAFANRLLIPLGLHHVINAVVWFQTPGDLNHFFCVGQFAADKTCVPGAHGGQFMTGFFPIMMFGLPAAALAMVMTARKENRRAIAGIMFSAALTSFVTGITEPIEFAFMFVAPVLYLLHAALTAASAFIVVTLGMRDGFTFSAGAIDFFLNRNIATNPLGLLAVGVVFGVIYFVVFYFTIKLLDIPTPGREPMTIDEEASSDAAV